MPSSEGHDWQDKKSDIAGFACDVLRSWIISGDILRKVYQATAVRLYHEPALTHPDSATELAGLTVAVALRRFHDTVIEPGVWDPSRGTRLRTFFIGQCLLRFPNEYRRWMREFRAGAAPHQVVADELADLPDQGWRSDTEAVVLARLEATELLASVPAQRTRSIVALRAAGFRHQEIADRLQTTAKAVEMQLYRVRCGYADRRRPSHGSPRM